MPTLFFFAPKFDWITKDPELQKGFSNDILSNDGFFNGSLINVNVVNINVFQLGIFDN